VHHFHYTYVPAGALTLKNTSIYTVLVSTQHFLNHFFRNVFKKTPVKTYNRLSSILLHVSDVEHPSSGSIAAHG
jgi:hypothetical protein